MRHKIIFINIISVFICFIGWALLVGISLDFAWLSNDDPRGLSDLIAIFAIIGGLGCTPILFRYVKNRLMIKLKLGPKKYL